MTPDGMWVRLMLVAGALASALASAQSVPASQSGGPPPDCGAVAVGLLRWCMGGAATPVVRAPDAAGASLDGVRLMAMGVGIRLRAVEGQLDDYLALPSPVILHLRDPAHYLVAMGAAGDSVLVADSGAPAWRAMARAELARRATGFGLVLDLPASAEAGRLALEPALADVGTVLGAVSPAEFTLSNRGAGPLGLRVESRSCTCTQVDWQERSLAPGERVVLKVATTPLAAGPFSTEVVLRTTDPTRPRVPLVLCGDWQPGVRLSPSRVVAKVAPGQTVRREVRVSGPAELVVRQAACADPLVEMSQKGVQVVGGRATALLELTLTGAKEPGIRLAELELSVAAPQAIRLVLPLAVETVPFVVVQPAAVAITALPASGETLNLRLDSVDGRPFAVTAVACDGLDARLLSARRQPDGSLLVAVKIAPRQPGLLRSNLALTLDHPGCPSVQVSLVARAAGG